MHASTSLLRVRVRFVDPDGRHSHFETTDYLRGSIVALIPGPTETNWLLHLDEELDCVDVDGRRHRAVRFLLKPNGLDAEDAMRSRPIGNVNLDSFPAMVMVLDADEVPDRIGRPSDYRNFAMIGDVRILVDRNEDP